jgi:hypothetical protein
MAEAHSGSTEPVTEGLRLKDFEELVTFAAGVADRAAELNKVVGGIAHAAFGDGLVAILANPNLKPDPTLDLWLGLTDDDHVVVLAGLDDDEFPPNLICLVYLVHPLVAWIDADLIAEDLVDLPEVLLS